jgi:Xaa-Pro dipeptidase
MYQKQFNPHEVVNAQLDIWRENRRRFLSSFSDDQALIYLKGRGEEFRNADVEHYFRQESSFQYLCGADYLEASLVIDLENNQTTLFIPKPDDHHGIWHNAIQSNDTLKAKYRVDNVKYISDIAEELKKLKENHVRIYVLDEKVELPNKNADNYELDTETLSQALKDARAVKSDKELAMMQYAADVSSEAHITLMKQCRPGLHEYQLESVFNGLTSYWGLRHSAYPAIVGSGLNSAILHYSANNKLIGENDLVLVDAGGEFHCYASDITRTYPANGKFTPDQTLIYSIVLDAQKKAIAALKPGVQWTSVVDTAIRALLVGLLEHGFVKGKMEDLIADRVAYVFMPHGLGHLAGLDVHDSNIFPDILTAGQVVTIEPGLYFNETAINEGLTKPTTSKYLIKEKIDQFMSFGGVRIEDILAVTETGCRSLSNVPKEIHEIEALMAK